MDAVSLALPTNIPAAALPAPADKATLPLDVEGAPIDFAALLAAGLDMQQQCCETKAPTGIQAAEETVIATEEETDPSLLPADPTQLLAPIPLPAQPIAAQRIQPQALETGAKDSAAEASLQAASLQAKDAARERMQHAAFGAEAANLAGKAAEGPAALAGTQFQAELIERSHTSAANDARSIDVAAQAAAHALNATPTEARPAAQQPTAVLDVAPPVGSRGFADALSQQVVWMVDKDAQVAELRINPPELGPVEVRLSVNGDQASAQFVSAHAEVREALETAITRLRESFAEAGIQLGQASVSAESFRDQTPGQADSRQASRPGYPATESPASAAASGVAPAPRVLRGLVDTFA